MQSAPSRVSITFTRHVLPGNARNKRGINATEFIRNSKHRSELSSRQRKQQNSLLGRSNGFSPAPHRAFGDTVVKGKPPKKELVLSRETRFTIPSSPTNANILNQVVFRCFETHEDVLTELKSFHKIHSFATDSEHEIEILS